MSALATHDPLVVNTQDGAVWMRRAVTREGRGLYAVADAPKCCPEFVMATLAELAEHGLASMADALPMPVGAEPQAPERGPLWSLLDWSLWGAGMGDVFREPLADAMLAGVSAETRAQAEQIMAEFIERRKIEKTGVTVWQEQRDELKALRARVAELEAERHSTNEALDDAVQALRAGHDRNAELEQLLADAPLPVTLTAKAAESADKPTALFAPTQVLRLESGGAS